MDTVKHIAWLSILLISSYCSIAQAITPQWIEHAQVDNAITLDIASLNTMYSQSTYLWIKNQKLSNQGLDAVDFISGSFKHGLNPDHYHLSELTQLNPSHDRLSVQQFDILLTDGLLTLIHDIAVGRLQANNVDSDWFIPQNEFNAVEFLQDALLKPHLKTQLNSLSPNTAEYHQLQAALSRYQSYVSRGSWLNIPSMPLTHLGERQKHIPLIRERLRFENKELVLSSKKRANYYDLFLEQAVRNFQHKHGLKVDGIIGSNTRKAMNISANERLQQIKVALERHRWMPRKLGQRYLLINVANYQLHGINNGNEALNMKVIVGRKSRPTPSFFSKVNHLVFNPYWNVPKKLARLDLLPKQQENLNYFYLHDIRVFTKNNGHKVEHDPYSIDWQSVSRSNFPYTFRQDPGENNALGKLKFMFPNQWSIYIHDTPHRELFLETKRALSSGCIRVEDPIALANFGLPKPKAQQTIMDMLESKENRGMKLSSPLSLYVVYFTVWTNDNGIQFSPDIYQRDKRIAALL